MTESDLSVFVEEGVSQEDKAALLIEVIQQYEFLYNLKHKDYKNNRKKEESWHEIAILLNSTVDYCQKLWKSLRDKYTRTKRDMGRSGAAAPEYGWHLFDKMLFYEKFTKPRPTYTATSRCSSASTSKPPSMSSISSGKSIWSTMLSPTECDSPLDETEGENVGTEVPDAEVDNEAPEMPKKARVEETPTSSKRKRKPAHLAEEREILNIAKNLAGSIQQAHQPDDINKNFCNYVYSLLNEMPDEKAKVTRRRILELIFSEEQ